MGQNIVRIDVADGVLAVSAQQRESVKSRTVIQLRCQVFKHLMALNDLSQVQ